MKTIKQFCEIIASKEGGKSQASIGDIREIVRIIADEFAADEEWVEKMKEYAASRKKKRKS